jgi:hypothetical protein
VLRGLSLALVITGFALSGAIARRLGHSTAVIVVLSVTVFVVAAIVAWETYVGTKRERDGS